MDQQRVEEKNEKEEQSEESESVTDRSEEEMSDMTIAFEWDKESAKNDDASVAVPKAQIHAVIMKAFVLACAVLTVTRSARPNILFLLADGSARSVSQR